MEEILHAFGLDASVYQVEAIEAGHINKTYKASGPKQWILQRVNTDIFKQPELIAQNISLASHYLKEHHPSYAFLAPERTSSGSDLAHDSAGFVWRMFPYKSNTFAINEIESVEQAVKISRGFAELVRNLAGCDVTKFSYTLPNFHDLHARFEQFKAALAGANSERIDSASNCIRLVEQHAFLVSKYVQLIGAQKLRLRVMHNDTKVNNILLDKTTGDVVCVIDLDTLMPGYYIYDLGDMIRTFVSPAAEDEKDLSKVVVRRDIRNAVEETYLNELNEILTPEEVKEKDFAGPMMTYIMALRFLTDFLQGDRYYHTAYAAHNLNRAQNQLRLLQRLLS